MDVVLLATSKKFRKFRPYYRTMKTIVEIPFLNSNVFLSCKLKLKNHFEFDIANEHMIYFCIIIIIENEYFISGSSSGRYITMG